jgi:predicted nucleic acid-binding protein
MYLLDTNVVSELRKAKTGRIDPNVSAWASQLAAASLFISAITVLEIDQGILLLQRRDTDQAAVLQRWFDSHVLTAFAGRVLAIDTPVARCRARLHVPNPQSERDALIAATALVHGMTVVTRNVTDFVPTGVATLNPWRPAHG